MEISTLLSQYLSDSDNGKNKLIQLRQAITEVLNDEQDYASTAPEWKPVRLLMRDDKVGGGYYGDSNKPIHDLSQCMAYIKKQNEDISEQVNAGFILISSFEEGATLTLSNEALLLEADGQYYRWTGDLPKEVPANSTPESSGGIGGGKWLLIGDGALRSELRNQGWDKKIGSTLGGSIYSDYCQSQFSRNGSFQSGGKITTNQQALYNEDGFWYVYKSIIINEINVPANSIPSNDWQCVGLLNGYDIDDVRNFGAIDNIESSDAVKRMLNNLNFLKSPKGFTLIAKNIELKSNQNITIDGVVKLPDNCQDFDRLFYADDKENIAIQILEIDGNFDAQVGEVGTHLLYFTHSTNINVKVDFVHDHYHKISSVTEINSPDGIRNVSTGCVFFAFCNRCFCDINKLNRWGREGIYFYKCNYSTVSLNYAVGTWGIDGDWSGIQISGDYNQLTHAHVENAGASGIGFDSRYSTAGKLISKNSRYFHGVNFGHNGFSANHSVIDSVIVDGCATDGISISANTQGLIINSFNIRNAGRYGINQTNGADMAQLSNGIIHNSHLAQVRVSASTLTLNNVSLYSRNPAFLDISNLNGGFSIGEKIIGLTSGANAYINYFYFDVSNSENYYKYITINSIVDSFIVGEKIVGESSNSTAIIDNIGTTQLISKYGNVTEIIRNCQLSTDPLFSYVAIDNKSSITVRNNNIRASSMPIIQPSNSKAIDYGLYLKTVADGYFIVETKTGNVAPAGTGFRYYIV